MFISDVRNNGKTAVTDNEYKVVLYKNDQELLSEDGIALEYNNTHSFVFELDKALLNESDKEYIYHAEVVFGADQNMADNKSDSIKTTIQKPAFPAVSDLNGLKEDNMVTLSWTEPAYPKTSQEKFDDFESYTPFIIDNIGDWTVVDIDGGETFAPNGTAEDAYPNVYGTMAFQIYNPKQVDAEIGNSAAYAPYSGDQYIIAWGTPPQNEPGGAAPNNDWLISPELSGYGEALSFYAKAVTNSYGTERFQVLYSTTDNQTESFIVLNSGEYEEVTATWTNFTYQIPFGAKYFAIRYISEDIFGLMIDDIKFESPALTLLGYNVYCNGIKLTETPITETYYTDNILTRAANIIYSISAVYDKGESYYSNEYIVTSTTGMDASTDSSINVFSTDRNICIYGAEGYQTSVISLDGKVLLNTTLNKQNENIAVASGVYFVKVGNKTFKVIVK